MESNEKLKGVFIKANPAIAGTSTREDRQILVSLEGVTAAWPTNDGYVRLENRFGNIHTNTYHVDVRTSMEAFEAALVNDSGIKILNFAPQ